MSTRGITNTVRQGNLRVASGSLAKPAIRYKAEPKSGYSRLSAGALSTVVNGFRALETTEFDTVVRSNGTSSVAPLSMIRANAALVDGDETRFEVYEGAARVGRIAAYRQTSTKYGFKFYGSTSAILSATPDLTITADGLVTARAGLAGTSLNVAGGAISGGALTATTGTFSSTISATAISGTTGTFSSTLSATAITGTSLTVGTGTITAGRANLSGATGLSHSTAWGSVTSSSDSTSTGLTVSNSGANLSSYFALFNNFGGTYSAYLALQGLASPGAPFLGNAIGDLTLVVSNGKLILGTGTATPAARLTIDTAGAVTIPGTLSVNGQAIAKAAQSAFGSNYTLTTTLADVTSAAVTVGIGVWLVTALVDWLVAGATDVGALLSASLVATGGSFAGVETGYWTATSDGARGNAHVSGLLTVGSGTVTAKLQSAKSGGSGTSKAELSYIKAIYLGMP